MLKLVNFSLRTSVELKVTICFDGLSLTSTTFSSSADDVESVEEMSSDDDVVAMERSEAGSI